MSKEQELYDQVNRLKWHTHSQDEITNQTGWIPSPLTWTYASASTFTVAGDVTAIFQKGTFLRWTQTTVKYGVVASSSYSAPNTTVTIIVNTDYTIASAAITNPYYSYAANPQGWPGWFNYSPTWTATSNPAIGNGTLTGRYSVTGRLCQFMVSMTAGSTTTFGSGNWVIGLPIAVSSSALTTDVLARARDSATASYGFYAYVLANGTTLSGLTDLSQFINTVYWTASTPFAWGNGDSFVISGRYEI